MSTIIKNPLTVIKEGEVINGKPIEINSLDNSLLTPENDGKVYKLDDKLYQVNKITSLKGLTIKFNEHIEQCPVINDDSNYECSGVLIEYNLSYLYDNNICPITAIKKNLPYNLVSGTQLIAFVAGQVVDGIHYISADNSEKTGWYFVDANENQMITTYNTAIITEFDCPSLNENPEFIDWVINNASVYKKIETLNDIEGFKIDLNQEGNEELGISPWSDLFSTVLNMLSEIGFMPAYGEYPFSGNYTVSFTINNENITKTFTNFVINLNVDTLIYFDDNKGNVLTFEAGVYEEGEAGKIICKYNNILLENYIIISMHNCEFNNSVNFKDYILTNTELVDMQYTNGCEFVEYLDSKQVNEDFKYKTLEILRGDY